MGWGFFSNLLGKKSEGQEELRHTAIHGLVVGDSQRSMTQQQTMELLGINVHMIEDEKVDDIFRQLALKIEKDGDGNPKITNVDLNVLGMIIEKSKVIRTSFIDPIDSELGQIRAKIAVIKMKAQMDEETFDLGGSNFLSSYEDYIKTAWCDAKNGRKAKLLKVYAKALEIRTPTEKKKGEGGWV